MTTQRFAPLSPNELEVSVFGPGKGESIVVGLPDGEWLVVDSFVVKAGSLRRPVAVEYLERLKVRNVTGVFITHWHDDHTRGAADLLRHYSGTLRYVGLPNGFGEDLLASFMADLLPNEHRFKLVSDLADVISVLKSDARFGNVRTTTLADLTTFPFAHGQVLYALSPSLADQQHQAASIATYLPGWRGPKPRRYDVNSGCAVLKLTCGSIHVLLGSDLDVGESDARGWRQIARTHGANLAAHIFKVGHHGSDTAFHAPAVKAINALSSHSAVTPFPARGEHLPREKMLNTYRAILHSVCITSKRRNPTKAGKVPIKDTPFSAYTKTSATSLDTIGQVRFRVDVFTGTVRTELFGGAAVA